MHVVEFFETFLLAENVQVEETPLTDAAVRGTVEGGRKGQSGEGPSAPKELGIFTELIEDEI